MSRIELAPGTLVKIEGVKAPVVVTVKHTDSNSYTVSGPRGEFLLTDCGTHWVRWPLANGPFARSASPRECRIESAVPMTAVA